MDTAASRINIIQAICLSKCIIIDDIASIICNYYINIMRNARILEDVDKCFKFIDKGTYHFIYVALSADNFPTCNSAINDNYDMSKATTPIDVKRGFYIWNYTSYKIKIMQRWNDDECWEYDIETTAEDIAKLIISFRSSRLTFKLYSDNDTILKF